MENADIIDLTRQTLWMIIKLGSPIMLAGLFVGVAVSLFQALTQIQEMTLTFIPKILVIFGALFLLLPWISSELIDFTNMLADLIVHPD